MIEFVNITQCYGITIALRNVSLTVNGGELVGVMGPNGMGKSTLLKVAAGLLSPLEGHVEINGLRRRSTVEAELAIRKQLDYLPDTPWLPNGLSGREFITAVGILYGHDIRHVTDHVERLLNLFQLTKQADASIESYSAGQKKKIALCSTLITEAKVLILDEPFSGGLDPAGIEALRGVLTHLAERDDVTILMATPVPELVQNLAHRIALIHNGELVACDTMDGLRRQAGTDGDLQKILNRLIGAADEDPIDRYFQKA